MDLTMGKLKVGHFMVALCVVLAGGNMRFSTATMATFELPSNIEARAQILSRGLQ